MKIWIYCALVVLAACSHGTPQGPSLAGVTDYVSTLTIPAFETSEPLTKVAFGSCANQDQPQPLWKDIAATKPDLFLFMGDNVYASRPEQQPIAEQYRKLDLIPEYRAMRETVPFMATWDDHDYGKGDAGAEWVGKASAHKDFLNYWHYMKTTIPTEETGVYHAKIFGPKNKTVQVIMLDTRTYRDPLVPGPAKPDGSPAGYQPTNGTILGETQWTWLAKQLHEPAQLRIIVSSIQVIADEPPFEKWSNFPQERQRLFDLLKKSHAGNVVIFSGDRHSGSISKIIVPGLGELYDVTASSINRPHQYPDSDAHYIGKSYNKENFGLASIDWSRRVLKIELYAMGNQPVNSVEMKLKK